MSHQEVGQRADDSRVLIIVVVWIVVAVVVSLLFGRAFALNRRHVSVPVTDFKTAPPAQATTAVATAAVPRKAAAAAGRP